MKIVKNVRILQDGLPVKKDIAFEKTILDIADEINPGPFVKVIDGNGALLLPGLVDVHVHLREPGYEEQETIESGTLAAAHGGFTTICAMPNLKPFPSDPEIIRDYLDLIEEKAKVHVIPYATITLDEKGVEPVDFQAIANLGIGWFSDDGVGVQSDFCMEKAMLEASKAGKNFSSPLTFACHTEDMSYRKPGASVHDSEITKSQGWIGIPSECEYKQLERDIDLLEKTGAEISYHGCHLSCKESVDLVKKAKEKGLDVSGEVTAHHLLLEDKDVISTNFKMNPPLRSHEDRLALIEGLETGALDFIASDHAPHTLQAKAKPMEQAPFGIVSLETSFILLYDEFVLSGRWSLEQLLNWMSSAPAKRFHFPVNKIEEGCSADFFLFDEKAEQVIDPKHFLSKGKNTPFVGRKVRGEIVSTFVGGEQVFSKEMLENESLKSLKRAESLESLESIDTLETFASLNFEKKNTEKDRES